MPAVLVAMAAQGPLACTRGGASSTQGSVQLGTRPLYLVQGMDEGPLKERLLRCKDGPFHPSDFSIGHRGAALQFPEHSDVAYRAGALMGAGIVECDVTFTRDGTLVCRHSECDLDATTDIVATDLNQKCTVPWTGPVGPDHPTPRCCTSDLTLAEFETLQAKMEASDPAATTAEGYLGGTTSWRTDPHTGRARVMTFRESIELNREMEVKHAPEFGRQAVYLDGIDPAASPPVPRLTPAELVEVRRAGLNILASPLFALLDVTDDGRIVPSRYAMDIRAAGLDIVAWTLERSDLRQGASQAGWYYQFDPQGKAVEKDSDLYQVLDVLAQDVGIVGVFSDWPATVTYYANCMGLR